MRPLAIEFIGTFFLVLVVALTGNPIAIGGVLIAMVYMGGYISGAHYNPAVTTALLLSKKITLDKALRYYLVQMFGAVAAAAVFALFKSYAFIPGPAEGVNFSVAVLAEAIFTFALSSVVLHTATSEKTKGNDYFGLAIGLVVMAGAFAVGPISGAAFNPAVGVGPLLFDINNLASHTQSILLYLIGPLLGAAVASIVYEERKPS